MAITKHEVLFFGGSFAGKTTLLASMWQRSNALFARGRSHIRVEPDDESAVTLSRATRALKEAFVEGDPAGTLVTVARTKTRDHYTLLVGRRGRADTMLELIFTDTPGGWSTEQTPQLTPHFQRSRVAVLAVDTVELFEGRGNVPIDLRRNQPELTQHLVSRWLQAIPTGKLLLCIVPVKCETILRKRDGVDSAGTAEAATQLHGRVRIEYSGMLEQLASERERVAVVIAPVQTVGNIVFAGYGDVLPNGYPRERWKQIVGAEDGQAATGYAPYDTDQPLRYVLSWALIDEIEAGRERRKSGLTKFVEGLFDVFGDEEDRSDLDWLRHRMLDIFGSDVDLVRAVSSFARHTKTEPPFEIVQGEALVRRVNKLWDFIDD